MKLSTVLPILVGGAGVLIAVKVLSPKPEAPKLTYVVAKTTIAPYSEVKLEMLENKEWTDKEHAIPSDYLMDGQRILARYAKQRIDAGVPIREKDVMDESSRLVARCRENPKMRPYPMKVEQVNGGAGFIRPGDHVDIEALGLPTGGASGNTRTKVIMTNVEVLAVNQTDAVVSSSAEQKDGGPKRRSELPNSVILMVTVAQAEYLGEVEKRMQGSSFKLLNNFEHVDAPEEGPKIVCNDINELFGITEPGAAVAKPPGGGAGQPSGASNADNRHFATKQLGGSPTEIITFDKDGRPIGPAQPAQPAAAATAVPPRSGQ